MLQTRVSLWRQECCRLAELDVLLLVSLLLFLDVVSSTSQGCTEVKSHATGEGQLTRKPLIVNCPPVPPREYCS